MAQFVKGLLAGLQGGVPDISKCIPDFQGAINDAQSGANDLVQGISSFSPSQCVSGVNEFILMLSQVSKGLDDCGLSQLGDAVAQFIPGLDVCVVDHNRMFLKFCVDSSIPLTLCSMPLISSPTLRYVSFPREWLPLLLLVLESASLTRISQSAVNDCANPSYACGQEIGDIVRLLSGMGGIAARERALLIVATREQLFARAHQKARR